MKNHLHNKNIAGYEHQDVQSERKQETTAFEYQSTSWNFEESRVEAIK